MLASLKSAKTGKVMVQDVIRCVVSIASIAAMPCVAQPGVSTVNGTASMTMIDTCSVTGANG